MAIFVTGPAMSKEREPHDGTASSRFVWKSSAVRDYAAARVGERLTRPIHVSGSIRSPKIVDRIIRVASCSSSALVLLPSLTTTTP